LLFCINYFCVYEPLVSIADTWTTAHIFYQNYSVSVYIDYLVNVTEWSM